MSLSKKEIDEFKRFAEKMATENLEHMEKADEILKRVDEKLESIARNNQHIIEQETGQAGKKRQTEMKIDRRVESEIEDSINRIREAKADLDEIIPVFKNNKTLDIVAGFGTELFSQNPDEEVMENITEALENEVGSFSKDRLQKLGRITSRVLDDVLEARKDIRISAKELNQAMGHEEEHIEMEENRELSQELKQEFEGIEEVIKALKSLVDLSVDEEKLQNVPIDQQAHLDQFLSSLEAASMLENWEAKH